MYNIKLTIKAAAILFVMCLVSKYLEQPQIEAVEASGEVAIHTEQEPLSLQDAALMVTTYRLNYEVLPFSREIVLHYLESRGENVEIWDALIQGESSWNLYADNPNSAAHGLFQIMPLTASDYCDANYLESWLTQARCSIRIKNNQGFEAWEYYNLHMK